MGEISPPRPSELLQGLPYDDDVEEGLVGESPPPVGVVTRSEGTPLRRLTRGGLKGGTTLALSQGSALTLSPAAAALEPPVVCPAKPPVMARPLLEKLRGSTVQGKRRAYIAKDE